MAIGMTLFIVAILIIAIWVVVEIRRFKHKLFAIFLIALILFGYLSFTISFKDRAVDLKTIEGLTTASKIYFSWLGSMFGNLKSVTSYAVKKDWDGNETVG